MKIIFELLSTYFYIGYLPAGGTFATVASFPLVLIIHKFNLPVQFILTVIFLVLAVAVSSKAESLFINKDDNRIVIDEVAGFLVSTLGINLPDLKTFLVLMFIFRILDIAKIGTKKIQKLPAGRGIVFDDLIAGLATNLIFRMIKFFCS